MAEHEMDRNYKHNRELAEDKKEAEKERDEVVRKFNKLYNELKVATTNCTNFEVKSART